MSSDIAHSTDRLAASAFVAIATHALLIFGISFALPNFDNVEYKQPPLDIVLAHRISDTKPDEADFHGQANQEGGGTLDDTAIPSATEDAPILSPTPAQVLEERVAQMEQRQTGEQNIVTGSGPAIEITSEVDDPDKQKAKELQEQINEQTAKLANIAAPLEMKEQLDAKKSKHRRISASIHESRDASYLDSYRRKIEYVGNLNYSDIGAAVGVYGEVTLAVGLKSDGTIHHIHVEKSSNNRILDDFAQKIIHLSAPFDPFPDEIKKDTEVLEIVRIFTFEPKSGVDARRGEKR